MIWDKHPQLLGKKNDMVQRRAASFVFGNFDRFSSVTSMINELGWSSLLERREWAKLKVIFKAYKSFRSWEEIMNRFQEPSYLGLADHRKKIRKPRFLKNISVYIHL